ncbi:MAG TPA: flagellar M-ring protein FliF, partial [Pseudothermotoga sp.]|nr:flagellar M-ring protein FliF [Pseudothermotoga sp.]
MEFLKKIQEYLKGFYEKWKGLPRGNKILFSGIAVSIIIVGILTIIFVAAPRYTLLVSGLTDEQSGYLIQQLETMGVEYKVEPGRVLVSDKIGRAHV